MLSLWQGDGRKGNTYKFIDRHVSNYMRMSGTGVYLYRYEGVRDADGKPTESITDIQDVLWLENRNRVYSDRIDIMRGCYNIQDVDFNLLQFGYFLSNDLIFMSFHINDMLAIVGRKIIAGDVLELPHLRDDMQLDPDSSQAINRFYVVQEANRSAEGYSATWYPHVWRVKLSPMTGAQEYASILNQQAQDPFGFQTGSTLRDILTTDASNADINEEVFDAAVADVSKRYFETRQFYYIPDKTNPWIFTGDGVPPNGAILTGSGTVFPTTPQAGDYFLRTDHQPMALYQYNGASGWIIQEYDYRGSQWQAANARLMTFLNNSNQTNLDDGTSIAEKTALSKVLKYKPEADL